MFIHVICSPKTTDQIKTRLKKDKRFTNVLKVYKKDKKFTNISKVYKKDVIKIETRKMFVYTKKSLAQLEKETKKIRGVETISFFEPKEKDKEKIKHIFFDIDSTITHSPTTVIYRQVKDKFARFTSKATIYFCTGRDREEVKKLIKKYKTSPKGIAEAGGIIIGTGLDNEKYGDRTEPDKLWSYIMTNYPKAQIDEKQQSRLTEVVLKKNTITKTQLVQSIEKSKAKVEYHTSKNTYHITAKNIDKGTAILYLTGTDELDLGESHKLYSVGDSNLDIPMFNVTDYSFAVKNADASVKKAADVVLRKDGVDGIDEIYDNIFGYS